MQLKKIAGVAVVAALFAASVQARELRSADVHPNDYPIVMAVKKIGEIMNQKSNGKYSVKVYPNSTLGSEKDTVEQTKIGALDMVRVSSSTFHSIVPETMIVALPSVYRDLDHFRKVVYGPIGESILGRFEKAGFVGLAFFESGARSIYTTKPLRNLADTKGMKIRVMPSELQIQWAKAIGANPIPIPYAEVYTALKTGLVDASENNLPSYETAKHYEVASIYSETDHMMIPDVLVFSKKVWDTLSAEDQKLIKASARESIPYYIDLWAAKEKASRENSIKAGSTYVSDVNKAEFASVMKPVWDKFANTPELKGMVQQIVDTK